MKNHITYVYQRHNQKYTVFINGNRILDNVSRKQAIDFLFHVESLDAYDYIALCIGLLLITLSFVG